MNILSDAALAQVRDLIRQEQGQVRGNRADDAPKLTKGPECFIAKTPVGGIPGRTGDVLGKADCDLYATTESAGEHTLSALMVSGTTANTRTVYNLSTSEVAEEVYIIITRTKGGLWMVVMEEC